MVEITKCINNLYMEVIMQLTKEDIEWWSTHNNHEIGKKYGKSQATIARTKKKYDISSPRKPGSGTTKKGRNIPCKTCGSDMWVIPAAEGIKKYCSRKCQHADPEFIDILKNIDKSYMQTEEYKNSLRKETTPEYKRYANRVHNLTKKTYAKHKGKINPRNHPRTICGVEGGWQLDHIIPISYGFENNIDEEYMASVTNLRMLSWEENLRKSNKVSPSLMNSISKKECSS